MRSLSDAPWLTAQSIQQVFEALEQDGDEARAVGGAVRNTLLGVPVADVDIATTAEPATVMKRALAHGLKPVPTGIDHGTVTVVSSGIAYEVTTLREDVETFGRHAVVRFGRDWSHDARRRDFTMNALYVDRHGRIDDPIGGYEDCLARRVRFIGDAAERIREDYLRILRFFRIHAAYGVGQPDPDGLHAAIRARDGLRRLSAERVGMEVKRLVTTAGAPGVIRLMESCGILEIVTGGVGRLVDFEALRRLDRVAPEAQEAPVCLVALSGFVEEDLDRLVSRFRLSNAERERMMRAHRAAAQLAHGADERGIRGVLFTDGRQPAIDGALLAWARSGGEAYDETWKSLLGLARNWPIPMFPVGGRDLLKQGVAAGPALGAVLARLRAAFMDSDYTMTREDLLRLAEDTRGTA
ncbi:CCA tRNA nucleotidyltransferase [Polymorphum gilvum]|uniref:tRNA nucleotidyltransferase/poly(A) polymerase family protein n=1 Tax=Polymorphum gilvum (strain LMG 25793 / CGMCC 1.9160 / SL003B-26A1) TaxID=991905 RepID=F2IZN6_POLGS|nr:CCA tRNA nucleotidyltransferase [Polymorphum gilvum]ADZ69593.1 tRNA nucleotidyltransferase/poly(A) polymerase family protein [Polymorphum gilvum SL003B-26A1]